MKYFRIISETCNYMFFSGQISKDSDVFLILISSDLLLYVSCVHLSALEVAALALVRSTESAMRSHGRLSGADS